MRVEKSKVAIVKHYLEKRRKKSAKDGTIKKKSNLSLEVYADMEESGRRKRATERIRPMEPSEEPV